MKTSILILILSSPAASFAVTTGEWCQQLRQNASDCYTELSRNYSTCKQSYVSASQTSGSPGGNPATLLMRTLKERSDQLGQGYSSCSSSWNTLAPKCKQFKSRSHLVSVAQGLGCDNLEDLKAAYERTNGAYTDLRTLVCSEYPGSAESNRADYFRSLKTVTKNSTLSDEELSMLQIDGAQGVRTPAACDDPDLQ